MPERRPSPKWPPILGALAALALSVALAGPALATFEPNPAQRNVLEHFAQIVAGTEVCDRWRLNERLLAASSLGTGLRITDPDVAAYLEERALFHARRIKGRTSDDICGALERLYGPSGGNVPDFVIPAR